MTDEQWMRIEPLLPSNAGRKGHPFRGNRRIVEGIIYRARTGIPWRDLPRERFGPWQSVWKRHRRYAADGTWDLVLSDILAEADADGGIDWTVSVDSTISEASGVLFRSVSSRRIGTCLRSTVLSSRPEPWSSSKSASVPSSAPAGSPAPPWAKPSVASRPTRCGTGGSRDVSIVAKPQDSAPLRPRRSRSCARRTSSCAARTRSCARLQLFSPRNSTAPRRDDPVHRRAP
ncbi:transposase [Brevibacterium luteolum]|nr:transposase [Brevibacterium luteolum]